MKTALGAALAAGLLAAPAFAQSSDETWNGLPERLEIDAGYFRLGSSSTLQFRPLEGGAGGEVSLEDDLGFPTSVNTFWVDGRWRLGRRHQVELSFTRLDRSVGAHTLGRDFSWGGETYNAGLTASSSESATEILGGYYRFALVRNDRFEVGPALGVGYLWLDARIRASGTITGPGGESQTRTLDAPASSGNLTGAIGAYANAWATERLVLRGDFLYIKVTPEDEESSVTDWRIGANYYFFRNAGLGVQYKYYRFSKRSQILPRELGGELTYKGLQVFVSLLF